MIQVHTVRSASRWTTTVDGLREGEALDSMAAAVAHGRRVAAQLGGRHFVHDVDGRVIGWTDFARPTSRAGVGPVAAPEPLHYVG